MNLQRQFCLLSDTFSPPLFTHNESEHFSNWKSLWHNQSVRDFDGVNIPNSLVTTEDFLYAGIHLAIFGHYCSTMRDENIRKHDISMKVLKETRIKIPQSYLFQN